MEMIYKALWRYFSPYKGYKYQLENSYVFDWESDFFCMSSSEYFYECEVKVSRSDFFADFNKEEKHKILSSDKTFTKKGFEQSWGWLGEQRFYRSDKKPTRTTLQFIDPKKKKRPHKFIYVCPEGLIEPQEVPDYAGLIWTKGMDLKYKKRPPFIHKENIDLTKTLLEKFYWSYVNEKRGT